MRLLQTDLSPAMWQDLPIAGQYLSALPSPAELTGSLNDPFNTAFFTDNGLVRIFGEDARTLVRGLMARYGLSALGFVRELAAPLIELVKSNIIAPVRDIIEGTITDVVDIALGVAGSVPVYGWVVKIARFLLNIAITLLNKPRAFAPPFARFDKQSNDNRTSAILNGCIGSIDSITTKSWDVCFRPPALTAWTRQDRSEPRGWSFQPQIDVSKLASGVDCLSGLDGLGWIIGTSRAITQINVPFAQWCPESGGGVCEYGGTLFLQGEERQRGRYESFGNPWDISSLFPSQGHLCAAVSAALQTNTALPFNFDPVGITNEWSQYLASLRETLDSTKATYANGSRPRDDSASVIRYSAASQVGALVLTVQKEDGSGWLSTEDWVDGFVKSIQRRQEQLLMTNVVAYCSEGQVAFKSATGLGSKLHALRQEFLRSPWARRVDVADIPDLAFRSAVADVQVRNYGLAARDVLGFDGPSSVPRPTPSLPPSPGPTTNVPFNDPRQAPVVPPVPLPDPAAEAGITTPPPSVGGALPALLGGLAVVGGLSLLLRRR